MVFRRLSSISTTQPTTNDRCTKRILFELCPWQDPEATATTTTKTNGDHEDDEDDEDDDDDDKVRLSLFGIRSNNNHHHENKKNTHKKYIFNSNHPNKGQIKQHRQSRDDVRRCILEILQKRGSLVHSYDIEDDDDDSDEHEGQCTHRIPGRTPLQVVCTNPSLAGDLVLIETILTVSDDLAWDKENVLRQRCQQTGMMALHCLCTNLSYTTFNVLECIVSHHPTAICCVAQQFQRQNGQQDHHPQDQVAWTPQFAIIGVKKPFFRKS
jgi:hypothetical protein